MRTGLTNLFRLAAIGWLTFAIAGCAQPSRHATPTTRVATSQPLDPVLANIDEAWSLLAARPDWTAHPAMNLARHPAEKHLAGLVIVLDPGHGMSDGKTDPTYKRGPTGVREDDMNLRTSLLLRKLLVDAGATVLMTRDTDALVTHQERADVANQYVHADGRVGADLFISVHHNAASNPKSNYTSVWYHGEVDWNGMELDVGRYVAHALGRHLRTDVAKTSPLLSDQLMYKSGFAMLRLTKVPAVLLEISFFSNPEEEKRLADATYNLRSAYAIYEGLCEWAYCGKPTQTVWMRTDGSGGEGSFTTDLRWQRLYFRLSDGLPAWWGKERNRIDTSSITVAVRGPRGVSAKSVDSWETIPPTHARATMRAKDTLSLDLGPTWGAVENDSVDVDIRFRNMLGNANYPTRYRVHRDGRVEPLALTRATGDVQAPVTRPATQPAGR